ncbi:hypothetical protein [Paucidesulfovibrio longus]|uniref:hypothetical protein n=1 Tax=Paucidesulfovibrio longus TaxID=889 RepID=UPI0012DDDB98|nr:hypothetical protein [Paucidesulfovibrio longus]
MHKTIIYMALAMVFTVLAALVSNDFNNRTPMVADAGHRLTIAPLPPSTELETIRPDQPQPESEGNITLPQKRAAALLFMGVLRDN